MTATRTAPFTHHGETLTPGVNVDVVDTGKGLRMATGIGYGDEAAQMVAEHALSRRARGEEDGAMRTWLSEYPTDLTSWYMILAAARAC